MSWIAVLLLGVAVTDLVRSVWLVAIVPEAAGAALAVCAGLAGDLTRPGDLVALVGIAAVVVAWGQTAWLATDARPPTLPAWAPLAVLGAALMVLLLCSVWAKPVSGAFAHWLSRAEVPVLSGMHPSGAMLTVAVFLLQLSSGNVIVRLVLLATGTTNPTLAAGDQPSEQLRGGRLLGPMERVFIVGLGLAGHVTAASIVIAAKGLLRFPELQAKREVTVPADGAKLTPTNIDKVTEYFLVGSFLSWLIALGSLVLLSGR
ncbi:MAG: hypothetical protein M3Y66_05285 [Actinomycetota bacterium]|nr:hypothetical protein [Actinomycetota bacterium]